MHGADSSGQRGRARAGGSQHHHMCSRCSREKSISNRLLGAAHIRELVAHGPADGSCSGRLAVPSAQTGARDACAWARPAGSENERSAEGPIRARRTSQLGPKYPCAHALATTSGAIFAVSATDSWQAVVREASAPSVRLQASSWPSREHTAQDVLAGVTRPRPISATTKRPTSAPSHHLRTARAEHPAKRRRLAWAPGCNLGRQPQPPRHKQADATLEHARALER